MIRDSHDHLGWPRQPIIACGTGWLIVKDPERRPPTSIARNLSGSGGGFRVGRSRQPIGTSEILPV